jgi:hypothetical protein
MSFPYVFPVCLFRGRHAPKGNYVHGTLGSQRLDAGPYASKASAVVSAVAAGVIVTSAVT